MAMKKLSPSQRRIDTKMLCNHCGFENTKYNRKEQDTHKCPVCSGAHEDRNHMFSYPAPSAAKNREKGLKSLEKMLDEYDTASSLKPMIIGTIRHVQSGTTPTGRSFGHAIFGGSLTTRSILEDQASIGWTNFLCGRWGMKWKEAQRR